MAWAMVLVLDVAMALVLVLVLDAATESHSSDNQSKSCSNILSSSFCRTSQMSFAFHNRVQSLVA